MKVWTRFRQGGGIRLVKALTKMGLLPELLKMGFNILLKGKSYKLEYNKLRTKIEPKLVKEFNHFLSVNNPANGSEENNSKEESNKYV